jgi:ribonuclease M5
MHIEFLGLEIMQKIKIKEILVVEGHSDTVRLHQFFDVVTIETGGSGVTAETLAQIKRANALYGVIVFTDPDVPGEAIRREISQVIPNLKHAFLKRKEATPSSKTKGRSLGIEHANFSALKSALERVYTVSDQSKSAIISPALLNQLGLTLGSDAKSRRIFLGEALRIGYTNAKQLKKRLALFQISEAEIKRVMKDYEEKTDENCQP